MTTTPTIAIQMLIKENFLCGFQPGPTQKGM